MPDRSATPSSPRRPAWTFVLAFLTAAAAPAAADGLPTERPWQRTLRDHLGTLTEVELEVDPVPVRSVPEQLDDDAVYRDWLLLGSALERRPGDREQPDIAVLRRPAGDYLLDSIEADDGPWMSMKSHGPMGPAWWAGWSYPGNPYFGSRAVALRGYVAAAVDMLLVSGQSNADVPDMVAQHLVADTYAYLQAIDHLPADVRGAFETAIGETLARMEAAGPTGGLVCATACAYVSRAVEDDDVVARARALARGVVEGSLRPAGYFEIQGGCDPAAGGTAAYHLAWAAVVAPADWDFLRTALARTADLRGHLLLPEPRGGICHGPTHFAPSGVADGFQDDDAHRSRDVAAAMLTGPGICLLFNDRPRRGGSAVPAKRVRMETQIGEAFSRVAGKRSVNAPLASDGPAPAPRGPWRVDDPVLEHVPYDHDYYVPGSFERFRRAVPLPVARLPVARNGAFVRGFDEEFLVARMGESGVIIHTGRIAPGTDPRGFSGGALSAFWTPSTGPVLLGRRQPGAATDTWDGWWRWQTHALAGTGADGKPFSTARLPRGAFTEILHDIGRDRATVSVSAPLHERGATENDAVVAGALTGNVTYSRRFDVDPAGVRVETTIRGDGGDRVGRLCEILPVFNDAPVDSATGKPIEASVYFDTGSGWRPAPPRPVPGVRRIRIDRHGGAVEIEFERPQRAGLAPEAGVSCHNILVELLARDGTPETLESFAVAYTIRPLVSRKDAGAAALTAPSPRAP